MKAWNQRPVEEANLLNPAFLATVLCSAVCGYESEAKKGMPLPVLHMVVPVVLRKKSRESLPKTIRTSLAVWLQKNVSYRLLFAERIISLKPYLNEAILFGLQHDSFLVSEDGNICCRLDGKTVDKQIRSLNGEANECVKKAKFIGRWFARSGSPETLMALWGIRP